MAYRTITLVIAAGAAACGGSQRAPVDTARVEQHAEAMQRALEQEACPPPP